MQDLTTPGQHHPQHHPRHRVVSRSRGRLALVVMAGLAASGCTTTRHYDWVKADGLQYAQRAPELPAPPPSVPAGESVTLSADMLFDFDSATLRPDGRQRLDRLVQEMGGVTYQVLTVSGHTDRLGSESHNQQLSQQRADTVRDYLISRGISASSIQAIGYGPSRPVTTMQQCPGQRRTRALVACLQPDRRVVVDLTGRRAG